MSMSRFSCPWPSAQTSYPISCPQGTSSWSAPHAGKLSEEDVKEMLANMELAAPEDVALVKLLSKWAKRGRRSSPEPQVSHLNLSQLRQEVEICMPASLILKAEF